MNKRILLKRTIITLVIALAVLGGIGGYWYMKLQRSIAAYAATKPVPITVAAATVAEQTWPNTLSAVGSLTSYRGITIKTELDGLVREVVAQSGAVVAAGDPIVMLDTAAEEAQLRGLAAQARLAKINLARARDLRSNGTNTQNDLDTAEASAEQTAAAVAQVEVTIAKKKIIAPFAGRLGIVKVYPGQFLAKGDALVVLESIDPIHADFSLPQQDLSRLAPDQAVELALDAFPGRTFHAKITAISPRVDGSTRNLDIRATLANTDEALRPGMYVRAEVMLPPTDHALVLPAAAVIHNPYGESVYVIEKGTVQQRFVKTGPERGDLIVILSGLTAGEQVVTAGQIKLRNGAAVKIDNSAAPEANPAPKPVES